MQTIRENYRILTINGEKKFFYYRKSRIPKGKGKFREIYIPSEEYKALLCEYIPYLSDLLNKSDDVKLNHAFLNDRNCVTNAMMHIGYKYCLSFDIKNFFDNIKKHHLSWLVNEKILDILLINGSPRQGLPTSPILSNIAFIKIDKEIYKDISVPYNVVYSRYADDIYFSFNEINLKKIIIRKIKNIFQKYQFEINDRKTTFQLAKNGNIIITGISVSQQEIRPTRKTLKKIRAAKHQLCQLTNYFCKGDAQELKLQQKRVDGLLEWSKCKLPRKSFNTGENNGK